MATAKLWMLSVSAQTLLPDLTPLSRAPELVGWSNAITLVVVILSVIFWARGEVLGKRSPARTAVEDEAIAKNPALEVYFNFSAQLRTITELLQSIKSVQSVAKLETHSLLADELHRQRSDLIDKLSERISELQSALGDKMDGGLDQVAILRDFLVRMEERDRQVLIDLNNRDRASTERDRALEMALHELINTVTRSRK
jgi:hypothetical protein